MAEIILHPCHPDYCNECAYHDDVGKSCRSEDYNRHSYEVNCVWHYCKYKRKAGENERNGKNELLQKAAEQKEK